MALPNFVTQFSLLKVLQFLFGIIAFALFFNNVIGDSVRFHIMVIATVGFPFVIVPSVLVSYVFENEVENSLVSFLLSICGFLLSLLAGIFAFDYAGDGSKAAGVFAIITSIVFLIDVVLFAMKKYRK